MKTFLLALCLAPAALAAYLQVSVPVHIMDQCEQGNGYCGINLRDMGYDNLINYDDNALYYCDDVNSPDYIKKCGGSCQGPKAHCDN
ncbi:hypothetical protein P170DRAFT_470140 [Aspergillus steynii IBT 23096]|uniref:Uncharacterized protein n=1 Tax=Aspergillus steynii IBT 23096 TaxID=1392250 RepID=A0A2I2GP87_9EURO|nr:uncharacterized protein P170DRAFT_470140 [Aspergillus steynii IBT 23096]PLB54692.1 hypothetical protein P170DRAFT_470140 [Aspergillus steynii IBT 23096]